MSPPTFQSLTVEGLHGDRTVSFEFAGATTILVGENGTGKTTALAVLNALFSSQWRHLRRLNFTRIVLTESNGTAHVLIADELDGPAELLGSEDGSEDASIRSIRRFLERQGLEPGAFRDFVDIVSKSRARSQVLSRSAELRELFSKENPRIPSALIDDLRSAAERGVVDERIWPELQDRINAKTIYLPTYRRVEEDLERLGVTLPDEDVPDSLIQFGMDDVRRRFRVATSDLKASASEWHARVSGQMLTTLIRGISVGPDELASLENRQALELVLARVGDAVTEPNRNEILRLIDSGDIRNSQYEALVYFLANLVRVYEKQAGVDARIQQFVETVNRYMVGKKLVYDERALSISVVDLYSDREVPLSRLSSGEKQTVSLFSQILLSSQDSFILIFDEPELSLSMEWQRTLLPDILETGRCQLLVAATHSPFIFDNELDRNARDLQVKRGNSQLTLALEG